MNNEQSKNDWKIFVSLFISLQIRIRSSSSSSSISGNWSVARAAAAPPPTNSSNKNVKNNIMRTANEQTAKRRVPLSQPLCQTENENMMKNEARKLKMNKNEKFS